MEDFYSDDSDEESQVRDLDQLTAVLIDEPSFSETNSQCTALSSCTAQSSTLTDLSKVDTALALNKFTDEKLIRLEKVLIGRLRECKEKLVLLHSEVLNNSDTKHESSQVRLGGKPYFKDSNNFPAPANEDALLMQKLGMYDFYHSCIISGWKMSDKQRLLELLQMMYTETREKEVVSKIAAIRRSVRGSGIKDLRELIALKKELQTPTVNDIPINADFDWEIVANNLRQHKPQEYEAFWKLYLHPSINKKKWSEQETVNMHKIAVKHQKQDWDRIATELGTGRTGYQCFIHYRTYTIQKLEFGNRWTSEEEEYFKRVLDYYKESDYIPWTKVAAVMQSRTRIQLYNKYLRMVEKRKGRFLAEEDAVIMQCAKQYGPNYKMMKAYIPGRSDNQLRVRYLLLCSNDVNQSTVWSVDEDKLLLRYMDKSGTKFSKIAKFFPGKDRVKLRARYITLTQWRRRHPNISIQYAPRRPTRMLCQSSKIDSLHKAVEALKKRLQIEVDIHKSKTLTLDSSEEAIENDIMQTLLKINKLDSDNEQQCTSPKDTPVAEINPKSNVKHECNSSNLRRLLLLLRANLNREKFHQGPDIKLYESIIKDENVPSIKIKSYSRKKTDDKTNPIGSPNIWGDRLPSKDFVLPPNYNTLAGIKNLMTYVNWKPNQLKRVVNMSTFVKRKEEVRFQYSVLLHRLNVLFIWPLRLDFMGPDVRKEKDPNKSI